MDAVKSRNISLPLGNRTPISRAPKLFRLFFNPKSLFTLFSYFLLELNFAAV